MGIKPLEYPSQYVPGYFVISEDHLMAFKEVALAAADVAGELATCRYDCLEKLNDALDRLEAVE